MSSCTRFPGSEPNPPMRTQKQVYVRKNFSVGQKTDKNRKIGQKIGRPGHRGCLPPQLCLTLFAAMPPYCRYIHSPPCVTLRPDRHSRSGNPPCPTDRISSSSSPMIMAPGPTALTATAKFRRPRLTRWPPLAPASAQAYTPTSRLLAGARLPVDRQDRLPSRHSRLAGRSHSRSRRARLAGRYAHALRLLCPPPATTPA